MKVTFISNFLNHHQLPFCLEMVERIGGNFKFIALESLPLDRKKMNYEDMNCSYNFCIPAYLSKAIYSNSLSIANESNVIILGSVTDDFINRIDFTNKEVFKFSEHLFKRGRHMILSPNSFRLRKYYKNKFPNIHLLCASAYAASDYQMLGLRTNKKFKWGYFPKFNEYDIDLLMKEKPKDVVHILWVGRMLKWKHPEICILLADRLVKEGYNFKMTIIGEGEQENKVRNMIEKYNLHKYITLLKFMSPDKVREYMEVSNIFLFTSDHNEGWGVVLNEAMNSGCCVVANNLIGSVPYLIEHGETGIIYKNNNLKDLTNKVRTILDDKILCQSIGVNAYNYLKYEWNAKIATINLLNLITELENGDEISTNTKGPATIEINTNYSSILNEIL